MDYTPMQTFQNAEENQSQKEALQGIQHDGVLQDSCLPYPSSMNIPGFEPIAQPATPVQFSAGQGQAMYGLAIQGHVLTTSTSMSPGSHITSTNPVGTLGALPLNYIPRLANPQFSTYVTDADIQQAQVSGYPYYRPPPQTVNQYPLRDHHNPMESSDFLTRSASDSGYQSKSTTAQSADASLRGHIPQAPLTPQARTFQRQQHQPRYAAEALAPLRDTSPLPNSPIVAPKSKKKGKQLEVPVERSALQPQDIASLSAIDALNTQSSGHFDSLAIDGFLDTAGGCADDIDSLIEGYYKKDGDDDIINMAELMDHGGGANSKSILNNSQNNYTNSSNHRPPNLGLSRSEFSDELEKSLRAVDQKFNQSVETHPTDGRDGGIPLSISGVQKIVQNALALKLHGVDDENEIRRRLTTNRMGGDCQFQFWCGFCERLVPVERKGYDALMERFDHIYNDHFEQGQNISTWVLPTGNLKVQPNPFPTERASVPTSSGTATTRRDSLESWPPPGNETLDVSMDEIQQQDDTPAPLQRGNNQMRSFPPDSRDRQPRTFRPSSPRLKRRRVMSRSTSESPSAPARKLLPPQSESTELQQFSELQQFTEPQQPADQSMDEFIMNELFNQDSMSMAEFSIFSEI
ncbi:uncharacterized protein GIQ15_04858 [Arthroderma uncinatum]|uniref:uncharacterized protein n=1 Tax=Arthroderma uncinatum TaxID=74035 RepID=UPI00144A6801|nr:uncharacterized protein GIQ15_04858 [Arthroderma uncinatum]KAF3482099.1 hypothetical protein GIQ15_04858 [Arthroderma uncinatum]